MARMTRRALMLGTGAALGVAGTRVATSRAPALAGTERIGGTPDGWMNDASGLSPTPVAKHIVLSEDPGDALVAALRAELSEARAAGRPVNVGAARHSMGAQALPRDGTAITLNNAWIESDKSSGTYLVHAGARWSEVIGALDPIGLSPKVMQSNNDFGVAATFSVNAHGWPVPYGPMGATVRSVRMVMPDGDLVTASRNENSDLFAMAMGGYGLVGLIVDMVVEAAPNLRLEPTFTPLAASEFAPAFVEAVNDGAVDMAYGRLNVDRDAFFEDALLITYRPSPDQSDLPRASGSGFVSHAASRVYRAQLGNEPMKRVRWAFESKLGPQIAGGPVTRNSLINEPVVTLDDRDPDRTDILHEYFVAPERFDDFLTVCREVIPASYQEMLNVTLRYIAADDTPVLTYAPIPRIAAVMSFSQEMTARAEADMARMTRALIDGIADIGGTYYLPYRPHATVDQFVRAYPRAAEFATAKRALDSTLTLRNNLWDTYLGAI